SIKIFYTVKYLKEYFSFEVGPNGQLIGFEDIEFGEAEAETINVTYYLNDDERSVYKNKIEITNPTLDKIRDTLHALENQYYDKGLWLDAKFEFENQLWSYNAGMLIPTSDDYIGGELVS
ncbi:MAG: hypothetical protein ACC656_11205, partial [Candidatus Heimdallarchaeota archaeon]